MSGKYLPVNPFVSSNILYKSSLLDRDRAPFFKCKSGLIVVYSIYGDNNQQQKFILIFQQTTVVTFLSLEL